MNWFQSSKDLIAVIIATLAVALSLVTVFMQRRQEQRAAYREIYTTLMSDDLHRGRWMIRRISKASDIPEDDLNVRLLYRTLGVFDNMAMFARHKVIPTKWVLELWHHPLNEMHEGVETLRKMPERKMRVRRRNYGLSFGSSLTKLSLITARFPAAGQTTAGAAGFGDWQRQVAGGG